MLEAHMPLNILRGNWVQGRGRLFLLLQELKHTLCGSGSGLQLVGDLGNLVDGLGEASHILDKGLNFTYSDGALHGQNSAQDGNAYISQVSHKAHDGHHDSRKELGFPCRGIEGFI